MNKQSGSAHIVLVGVLIAALLGSLGFIFWQNVIQKSSTDKQASTSQQATDTTKTDTTKDTAASSETVKTGTVKGTAIYPSEAYPQDFKVCVLNSQTKAEIVCDNAMAGKTGKNTYEVTVTPGEYLVAAKTSSMIGYYDGYMQNQNYNKAGIDLCKDAYHTPLTVTVVADGTVSNVDAGDFYYMPENCK